MARKYTTGLILLAVLLAGCDDTVEVIDRVGPEIVRNSDCSNETDAIEKRSSIEATLSGDIDGAGGEDEVGIVVDPAGDAGCRSFLIVTLGPIDAVYSTAVDPSGTPRSLPEPTLNSLAEINGEAGLEIVVNVEAGASTQFVAAFTLGERLERMTVKGNGPGPFANEAGQDDLFAFGGSVGHLEGVDCTDDGMIHMVSAIPEGDAADMYRVEHRFFIAVGSEVLLDESLNEVERAVPAELGELSGLAGSPFLSCD